MAARLAYLCIGCLCLGILLSIPPQQVLAFQSADAGIVVQGRVTQIEAQSNTQGWIYTLAAFRVEEQFSGPPVGQQISLRYNGGTLDGITFSVDTEPVLKVGDQIKATLIPAEAGAYRILGGESGVTFINQATLHSYSFLGARWDVSDTPVPYYINENGTGDTGGEFEAVQAAYQTWNNVSCHYADYAYQGTTAAKPSNLDGLNVVGWLPDAESPCPGVIACAPFWSANGRIIETDIVFDENKPYSIGGTFDIQALTTHEGGHNLGLGHSDDTNAVMYAYYPGGTRWRTLTTDDINGICALYPPLPPPDLDVAYIARLPRYDYDASKNLPSQGDLVTFEAHIANRGGQATG